MLRVRVKKLNPSAKLPHYAHGGPDGDLAADLYSLDSVMLAPQSVVRIGTGIAVQLPPGYGAVIEDRSGLATKGLTTLAGVIDPGYRGELRVVVANVSVAAVEIRQGDRIAQLRLVQRFDMEFEEVDQLEATARNEGGFGSTGR